jgi:hypothetical protein
MMHIWFLLEVCDTNRKSELHWMPALSDRALSLEGGSPHFTRALGCTLRLLELGKRFVKTDGESEEAV